MDCIGTDLIGKETFGKDWIRLDWIYATDLQHIWGEQSLWDQRRMILKEHENLYTFSMGFCSEPLYIFCWELLFCFILCDLRALCELP